MLIRKKPPRSHALGEPLLHQNHPLPVTRRDFVAAGFLSGPAMVIGPAWLGALLEAGRAGAGGAGSLGATAPPPRRGGAGGDTAGTQSQSKNLCRALLVKKKKKNRRRQFQHQCSHV